MPSIAVVVRLRGTYLKKTRHSRGRVLMCAFQILIQAITELLPSSKFSASRAQELDLSRNLRTQIVVARANHPAHFPTSQPQMFAPVLQTLSQGKHRNLYSIPNPAEL